MVDCIDSELRRRTDAATSTNVRLNLNLPQQLLPDSSQSVTVGQRASLPSL